MQQNESHLAAGLTLVASIRKERFFVAAGTLDNRIDRSASNARRIQLQGDALLQVKLPVAKADFPGYARPVACALAKTIAHRSIDFIVVSRNARTDAGADVSGLATEDFAHRHNGSLQQAGRGAAPAQVDDRGNVLVSIIEYNREAVRNKDAEQYIALVGNDRVTFDTLKMRDFRIGLVDHQDFTAMDLFNGQEQVWLEAKAPRHDSTVRFDLGALVTGAETEVERVVRRPAATAIAGRKAGSQFCQVGPGRLHEMNFALLNCFHPITFQQDLNEE